MELSLDLCLAYVPKTVSELLRELSAIRDASDKMVKLQDYVNRLEDEMRKIDAFKRELPLCMLLLNDAIERLKEEAILCSNSEKEKGDSGEDDGEEEEKDSGEKKNWMSSAQLWGRADSGCEIEHQGSVPQSNLGSEEENGSARITFAPLKISLSEEDKEVSQAAELCLATPMAESGTCSEKRKSCSGGGEGLDSPVFAEKVKVQSKTPPQQQGLRKQRRCWSPELHRRFVDALQRLGGSKVATPKQIRELMQVDGLTNDEVKSHLQKYRLHIRKLPASSENVSWMDKDHCREPNNSHSGSPQGPLCRGTSTKGISSNGDESTEAEEDDKSECHSWKGQH